MNIKGLFFEEERDQSVDEGAQATPTVSNVPRSTPARVISVTQRPIPNSSFVAVSASVANVDPATQAKLETIAAQANQSSYKTFAGFIKSLESVLPDERTLYRAALASANQTGHTTDKITGALDVILQTLDGANQQFEATVPLQIQQKVGARQQDLSVLEQDIQTRQQQITQLQQEVNDLSSQRAAKVSAIDAERQKIEGDAARFRATFTVVRQSYANERDKVARYGQEVA